MYDNYVWNVRKRKVIDIVMNNIATVCSPGFIIFCV
jgi:hypothetical protein